MRWVPKAPSLKHGDPHSKQKSSLSSDSGDHSPHAEKLKHGDYDNGPLPRISWMSLGMAVLVSMGGFIFGYDTGMSIT